MQPDKARPAQFVTFSSHSTVLILSVFLSLKKNYFCHYNTTMNFPFLYYLQLHPIFMSEMTRESIMMRPISSHSISKHDECGVILISPYISSSFMA